MAEAVEDLIVPEDEDPVVDAEERRFGLRPDNSLWRSPSVWLSSLR